MISITDKSLCCGCNACADICPARAISFVEDDEGFQYPTVDVGKCTQCGLCEKVCPCLHPPKKVDCSEAPKSYAAIHKMLPMRFASTSGGAFTAFAKAVLRDGGAIGGAVWTDDFGVRQIVSSDPIDLLRIRGSKYAQSDARGFYTAINNAVATGNQLLVCGTPCQIAAVRNSLTVHRGGVPDGVFLVDFICCGNNSPLVMKKFLEWQEAKANSKLVSIRQKSKELGWRQLTFKLSFKNGKTVYEPVDKCLFTQGFIGTHQYCRQSCYACKFKGGCRASDITIADYWGNPRQLEKGMDDDLGTSALFVRTERGERLLALAKSSLRLQEIPFEVATDGNAMYSESLACPREDRQSFFKDLREHGFDGVVKYFPSSNSGVRSLRQRAIALLRRYSWFLRGLGLLSKIRTLRVNGVLRLLSGKALIVARGPLVFENDGTIDLRGDLYLGGGFLRTAPSVTALAIRKGGSFVTHGVNTIYYGADIEVFQGAKLEIGRDCVFNLNANIICGGSIKIGDGVSLGRNVTIRDNNGGHWMNTPGYRNVRPVEIGDHVWLTEGCTIMPGVKIGAGAIVGAKAVVFDNVPANSLVMGNPAKVVSENVEWKR